MVMSFFRRPEGSGLENIESQVQRMVNDARHTFDLALNAVTGGAVETVADEIRETDRQINATEVEIRRALVVHASVHLAHSEFHPSKKSWMKPHLVEKGLNQAQVIP